MKEIKPQLLGDGTPIWVGLASEETGAAMDEFRQVVRLQQAIGWTGEAVPTHTLRSQALGPLTGLLDLGYVLLAKDRNKKVVGFARVAATGNGDRHYLHEVATSPRMQGKGLGLLMMEGVREESRLRGVHCLFFTFSALNPRNAFFYLEKCGAIGIRLLPDLYGKRVGGLSLSFLARWDLISSPSPESMTQIPVLGEAAQFASQEQFKFPVPESTHDVLPLNHPLIRLTKDLLVDLLARDQYQVTGFERGNRSFWICSATKA